MSLCINPNCNQPQNPDTELFCQNCDSELLLWGRYRVTQLLSDKGGFGKIYQITHKNTSKVLILKILHLNDPKALSLFKQEAEVLSQLNYPGIPRAEEYLEFFPKKSQTPVHCLVMQHIEGMDLEEYQNQRKHRPIDQKLALEWLFQLTQILDKVHHQNFFHRDIKPSNIILQPSGQLALIDFGTVGDTKTTSSGYTPPDQEHGHAVMQSDFFALGRTFVYLVTGKPPTDPGMYDADNNQLNWHNHAPQLSPQLANFIDKLMAQKASGRPANTQVIWQRLTEIEQALYPSVPQTVLSTVFPGGSSTRRQFITLASLAGVGLVVASAHKVLSNPITEQETSTTLTQFNFEVVTVNAQGNIINRQPHQAEYFAQNLGNGITLDMVSIPGGTFLMGSPDTEKMRSLYENPQHQVTVAPFFMGRYPVTQGQWRAVAALPQVNIFLDPDPSYFKGDNLPVEQVSWDEAVEFCERLSKKTGHPYRLPSEAEWEYACRAGTITPFHFGETITTELANYNVNCTYRWEPKGIYRGKTTPVGSFPPNGFGLYDMHGNVWEWCADPWHENYNHAPSDGSVWSSGGDDSYRLVRGASCFITPWYCRSAYRIWGGPGSRWSHLGFRLALSLARTL